MSSHTKNKNMTVSSVSGRSSRRNGTPFNKQVILVTKQVGNDDEKRFHRKRATKNINKGHKKKSYSFIGPNALREKAKRARRKSTRLRSHMYKGRDFDETFYETEAEFYAWEDEYVERVAWWCGKYGGDDCEPEDHTVPFSPEEQDILNEFCKKITPKGVADILKACLPITLCACVHCSNDYLLDDALNDLDASRQRREDLVNYYCDTLTDDGLEELHNSWYHHSPCTCRLCFNEYLLGVAINALDSPYF